MKNTKFEKLIILVAVLCVGSLVPVTEAEWVAYNDCIRQTGDSTAANVTGWTVYSGYTDNNTGLLLDFATGSDVGMPTVTFPCRLISITATILLRARRHIRYSIKRWILAEPFFSTVPRMAGGWR
ncbi:MAG: hypothetical protein ACYSW3_07640 [Planctomycetota bacterium]